MSLRSLAEFLRASISSASKEIGTLVSTPSFPTMAGKLKAMSSMPYSPCIIFEIGRMDFSSRRITSQILLTETAMP